MILTWNNFNYGFITFIIISVTERGYKTNRTKSTWDSLAAAA